MSENQNIQLIHPSGESVEINLLGGQVSSWKSSVGIDRLYRSAYHTKESHRPLRGGVPICFPQFGTYGPTAKHGFARNLFWSRTEPYESAINKSIGISLFLTETAETLKLWPFKFSLQLDVILKANELNLKLSVTNTDSQMFSFTGALHTYLALADIREYEISGLELTRYIDTLVNLEERPPSMHKIRINGEYDNIYLKTSNDISVSDLKGQILYNIKQSGFEDTVVWNPGLVKALSLGDMPQDDWIKMLCIEATQVNRSISLSSGDIWSGSQTIKVC